MGNNNERKTAWEVLYDFLTEIFAILIPGAFFISFFVFMVLLYFCCTTKNTGEGSSALTGNIVSIFGLLTTAVTYCFGAFFHRREIKVVDQASARHIYRKSNHESGHAFAFANALSEDYIRRIAYILHYHLYLLRSGVTDPSDCVLKLKTGEEKKLNDVIEEELSKTAELVETERVKNPQTGGKVPPRVLELIQQFQKRKSGDASAEKPELQGRAPLQKEKLLNIVRKKLLAEQNNVQEISREDSREYKEFLLVLNEECHGMLKERLERKIWKTLAATALEPPSEKCEDIYGCVYEALNDFCPASLREFTEGNLPKIKGRLEKAGKLAEQLKKIKIPQKEMPQLEHAVRRIHGLICDDLNSQPEWPYTRMYQYCADRGLRFATLVDWGDGAAAQDDYVYVIDTLGLTTDARISDEYKRSKIRVNTDKIEIGIRQPALGRILEKNEAHIRFNNSMWYAGSLLVWPLSIILALSLSFIILGYCFPSGLQMSGLQVFGSYISENMHLWWYISALCLVYFGAVGYIYYSVREVMHYQRVRELTIFLEAKYLMQKETEERKTDGKPASAL